MLSHPGRSSARCRWKRLWHAGNGRWMMPHGLCKSCIAPAPAGPRFSPRPDPSGAGPARFRTTSAGCSLGITTAAVPGRRPWSTAGPVFRTTPTRCPSGQAATSESAARLRRLAHPGSRRSIPRWEESEARECGRGFSTNTPRARRSRHLNTPNIYFKPRHCTHTQAHTYQQAFQATPTILVILLFPCIVPFREA